jgi:hypothetical protein
MNIISTFLPPEVSQALTDRPSVVMAFDTLVKGKSHIVGITVGRVEGPDLAGVRVGPIGHTIIERCCNRMDEKYTEPCIVIAGVASIGGAKKRVGDVLAKAPENSFVLLVCADNKVYDAAFPALGVDMQSANV